MLDGYVARLDTTRQSVLGADLDSLSDVISFGVAPAVLGFTLGLRGGWDMLLPDLLRGVRRQPAGALQRDRGRARRRRHRQGEVSFEGTPIPTSIVIVALLGVAFRLGRIDDDFWFGVVQIGPALLHPLALVYAASGSAMISATLRVPKP